MAGRQADSPAPSKLAAAAVGQQATIASRAAVRGDSFYVGHRGSGDVYPEHTLEGYQRAVAAGAQCVEISVQMTSDGVLVCLHDATLDRTTTATGTIAHLPSTALRGIRLNTPQLGPAWSAEPRPMVPLFDEVLAALGGRVAMCIEAKNDDAYPKVVATIGRFGLTDSVIVKLPHTSPRFAETKAAGFAVFAYFGSVADVTTENITALKAVLDPKRDYLVLPVSDKNGYTPDSLVDQAVRSEVPVWVFPAHRRVEARHFIDLGCKGIVTSSLGYVTGDAPVTTRDTWAYGAIAPGEMTKDPALAGWAPQWSGNELHLTANGAQHFLTLGQFCPLAAAAHTYTINVEASWKALPQDTADNITLAFGHADDAYYEHRSGLGNGYHAIVRGDGRLELFRHRQGRPEGEQLGPSVASPTPEPGQWMGFRLQVTPNTIAWTRLAAAGATGAEFTVTADDGTYRGGYLHIGRSSTDGSAGFRSFSVH